MSLEKILDEIRAERARQDAKWGQQDHPSLTPYILNNLTDSVDYPSYYDLPLEAIAKENCEDAFKHGEGSYAHIAVEEMCEVVAAPNDDLRREELIQLAAVCAAWIESIDRRKLSAMGLKTL